MSQKREMVLKKIYCTPLGLDYFISKLYDLKREFSEYPELKVEFGSDAEGTFYCVKTTSRQKVQL